jgi:predicted Zn-dependent peptidase
MNSRLNRELREKRGLVYTVDSALTLMSDCGSMLIYFGSQPDKVEKCLRIISDEISRLASDRLSPRAFDAARDQYCGQLTVSGDHRENCAMALAKSLLYFGEVHDIAHTAEQIRAVTPDDLRDMAALIASKELSRLTLT